MNRSEKFARFAETKSVSSDLKRKSVLGALVTGGGGAVDLVLRLASTLILARLLVPEDFGLVAIVTAVAALAERFSTLGLSTATVQAAEITEGQCSNLFWVNIAAGLLFGAMLVLLAPAIASFYEDSRLKAISVAISMNFVWTGVAVQHVALLRRQMKLAQIATNRLAATFLSVCLAIALALGDFGYWALVWKEVSQPFFLAVGAWMLCPWVPGPPRRGQKIRRLLSFGRDITLTQLLLATTAQLDTLLIGKFGGAFELGLYRQAGNLMKKPIDRFNAPIFSVSQPGLSMLQHDPARYRRYYQRILFAVSLATVPLGVFTAIYAHEIVFVALGEKWLGAVVFLRIFAVAAVIGPASGTSSLILITRGASGRFLFVNVVTSAAIAGFMILGINWGAVGIASARVAAIFLAVPWALSYTFAGSPVSLGDFVRTVSGPLVAALAMGVALSVLRTATDLENAALSLALGAVAALVVYFLTLNFLPGARGQLHSLVSEVVSALRRRSATGVEGRGDAA